jgi:hypothetical protein
MNARKLLIPLLCMGAVAFACGPRAHSEASLVTVSLAKSAPTTRKKQTPSAVPKITSSFTVTAEPHALRFSLEVTNVGRKNVELAFPDGQTHDFAVLNGAGREVYRWGAHHMFTQSVQNKQLDGGDTMHVAEQVTTDLPPGEYVAVATLRSTNFPVQERVAFQVR